MALCLGLAGSLFFCLLQVQENCIDLVGRIADRGAEYVPAREWMRICFESLEMLKVRLSFKEGLGASFSKCTGRTLLPAWPAAQPQT